MKDVKKLFKFQYGSTDTARRYNERFKRYRFKFQYGSTDTK